MPAQPRKSKKLRRVFVRTPGGKLKIHYRESKPGKAKCAICKKPLHGLARKRPYKMKKMAKTKKRPSRLYGGMFCSACMRKKIIEKARSEK